MLIGLGATVRAFLIGGDDARAFDVYDYRFIRMDERPWWWRLNYRLGQPALRLDSWMKNWDYRFRMRYVDRWLRVPQCRPFLAGLPSRGVQ